MFFFQQLLNQALAGIDGTAIIGTVTGIAYAILLVGFLVGLYQAALRGGDVQALAVTGIKYLVVAIVLANWSAVFREVNGSFVAVAQFIDSSSGAHDMFGSWMDQLKQQYDTTGNLSFWDLVSGTQAGMITAQLLLIAYILYAFAVAVFSFFYTLFGAVLYVLGPLVLALLPMGGIGQLAKSYATNVAIWNAWGILYATFGALMTAVQVNNVNAVLTKQGFLGYFQGLSDTLLLGLISIFYALALFLIPLIARRIIAGEVGATMFSLVRAGAFAAGNAVAAAAGFSAAAAPATAAATAGSAAGAGSAGAGASGLASAMPPPVPSMGETLRAHIASALGGPAPKGVGGSAPAPSAAPERAAVIRFPLGGGFRPHGLAQQISYQAGRMAGNAAKSSDNPDQGGKS